LALAERWNLVLVARRRERLDALAARIVAAGGHAWAVDADLAKPEEAQRVVTDAVKLAGGLDALVNNAGAFTTAPVERVDAAHIADLFPLNLRAPILLAAAAIPHLAQRGGTIINVTSVAADAAFAGCAVYAASKAGLEAWSRVAREELRSKRIRVGVIAPGATATEVWPADSTFDRSRMCRPEDIAAAIRLMLEAPAGTSIDRLVVTPAAGAF
jgi:NADP-dependent 3-hydroxy acid dehydrogenase YdfG